MGSNGSFVITTNGDRIARNEICKEYARGKKIGLKIIKWKEPAEFLIFAHALITENDRSTFPFLKWLSLKMSGVVCLFLLGMTYNNQEI